MPVNTKLYQPLLSLWLDVSLFFLVSLCINPVCLHAQQVKALPDTLYHQPDTINFYLTFDDGIIKGSRKLSPLALSEKVPVTIFLIGKFVCANDSNRLVWQEDLNNQWLEAGNHSFSHADNRYHLYYQDPQHVLQDFQKNQDSLGLQNKIARLPGRNVWRLHGYSKDDLPDSKAAADSLAANGYKLFGWDIEWYYTGNGILAESGDDFLFRIELLIKYNHTHIPGNVIILCHDPLLDNDFNISQLKLFIKKTRKKRNYRFRFLSEYPL